MRFLALVSFLAVAVHSFRWRDSEADWNLNQRKDAEQPLDYWGEWEEHDFTSSPKNWRMPFYTLMVDRFVDGDPTNNDANGTVFEHDWKSNQFRFGGDVRGVMNHLDYIEGLGIKAIYIAGSPFLNQPWGSDGYGALDFTVLDHHHGTIEDWRALVDEIHRRDMYIVLDNTVGTMGNLIGSRGWENQTVPFNWNEYDAFWKTEKRYHDFDIGNKQNATCNYPRMWGDDGLPLNSSITDHMTECRDSEFDQYGDMSGVGAVPVWETQLSKFASVQDRLRLWQQEVLDKVMHFSCMQIAMLDIDGFRVDKALQTPADQLAEWAEYQRQCAKRYNKDNFLVVGEAVGQLKFSSIFYGRGMEPKGYFKNETAAQLAGNDPADADRYVRSSNRSALDAAAFHYPTYGALTRFLGLDGYIGFEGVDFAEHWNRYLQTDDMVNTLTGEFDPRHMYGTTNQDVFRWPGLTQGTERQLLGLFITTLELPGIPMYLWGEEQESQVLESLAADYLFGRQPMTSSRAWQLHGCYGAGAELYHELPLTVAAEACHDDSVSLDHRDATKGLYNIIKRMLELRQVYPVLNDGYTVRSLSSHTYEIFLPGSAGLPSPHGLWSVYRGRTPHVQDFAGEGAGNQGIWIVYHNENRTVDYSFDCKNASDALLAAFPEGTTVKNLFYPYEEVELGSSDQVLGIEDSSEKNGCLARLTMKPFEYKAYVPKAAWIEPAPVITSVEPKHDARIKATVPAGKQQTVRIQLQFSREMDCDSVADNTELISKTSDGVAAKLNRSSVDCQTRFNNVTKYVGDVGSEWVFSAELYDVSHGVHAFTVANVTSQDKRSFTNSNARFMFRVGDSDNPMVFPASSNFTEDLFRQEKSGELVVSPKAAGADKWSYSTNWGSTWSSWLDYTGEETRVKPQEWSGTKAQEWDGTHLIARYWSELTGSSDHVQHSDDKPARHWPFMHVQGMWNQYGYDGGLDDKMSQTGNHKWQFDLAAEWPSHIILNMWGMNPDGAPDKSAAYGDVDGDGVLDWVPPDSLAFNQINLTHAPNMPHIGHRIVVDDSSYSYSVEPVGSAWIQLALYLLLVFVSLLGGIAAVLAFLFAFYRLKTNLIGITETKPSGTALAKREYAPKGDKPRTVLIATMEYEIIDWAIKIKIGGLGVMASLMGKNLSHQNLIWVVPCVGDVEYPSDTPAEPMVVTVFGKPFEVMVQYHKYENITYVLLDAPIFRQQTKAEPYPARMDDIESSIYYSAWNACIAETYKRFPEIDLYHINDYHGALAPLYLLPRVIPCCLSLHNAEFQGLWSISTQEKLEEVSSAFNLDKKIVKKYVQFGEVFNLLHAGASYLRIHQNGFGAVGVSKKYGKRSFARYPIFWGLKKIGSLPNPDPSDTAEWDKQLPDPNVTVSEEDEAKRGELRKQAQEWAGLKVDEKAELFVFVGRWSMQKGVDVIADVFPTILEENKNAQLICIGPVIDLYGKFAAMKLARLMEIYPDRVYSKPEFTALPPFIFSGAEFALIPSRDEPFGLVAVEFGRKGALGVGARVGGLGNMPGWWFTVESTTTKHLISQFKGAIKGALASSPETRAVMRARSALQRFPVAQWVEDLEILQGTSIKYSTKYGNRKSKSEPATPEAGGINSGISSELPSLPATAPSSEPQSRVNSLPGSRTGSRSGSRAGSPTRMTPEARTATSGYLHSQALSKRLAAVKALKRSSSGYGDDDDNGLYVIKSSDDRNLQNIDEDSTPGTPAPELEDSPSRMSPSVLSPPLSGTATPAIAVGQSPYGDWAGGDSRRSSTLSVQEVVGDARDYKLQDVDPSFTDPSGIYARMFGNMLSSLDSKTSEGKLCIEDYLVRSEKNWFNRFHDVKLGKSKASTPASSLYNKSLGDPEKPDEGETRDDSSEQFMLHEDYKPPTGIRKLLNYKIGDWPIYSFLLAFGQIIAANSYQITLITGENGQTAEKLYVVASIYLAGSLIWWLMFRRLSSLYALSLPWFFYGLAFFMLGMAPYGPSIAGRGWIQNVATGFYALASSSGSLFFALNFGSEGGQPVQSWIFRACVIQGTQQIYVTVLWYWGSSLTAMSNKGIAASQMFTYTPKITAVTTPIAVLLWAIGVLLFLGLPSYYRSAPGAVPSFYRSIWRRKVILWFFVAVILQNYWLSAPYGRNWRYLWSSNVAPAWSIVCLVILFFVFVWAGSLKVLAVLSTEHSWLLPIFAIGLGAPRWCQMLWGTSGIGEYLPWAGGGVGSVLAGRSLWLWLGVLDALQGVGFGMILLQTLTRFHIAFSLTAAQVLGSVATIVARATAPDATGPGTVFPNLALGLDGLGRPFFWVGLVCQLIVCGGFFFFFRKEQLFKP